MTENVEALLRDAREFIEAGGADWMRGSLVERLAAALAERTTTAPAGDESWRAAAEVILERIKVQDQPALDFIAKVVQLSSASDSTRLAERHAEWDVREALDEYFDAPALPVSSREQVEAEILKAAGDFSEGYDFENFGHMVPLDDVQYWLAALPPAAPKVTAEQIAETFTNVYHRDDSIWADLVRDGEKTRDETPHTHAMRAAAAVLALLQQGGEAK